MEEEERSQSRGRARRSLNEVLDSAESHLEVTPPLPLNIPVLEANEQDNGQPDDELVDPATLRAGDVVRIATEEVATQTSPARDREETTPQTTETGSQTSIHIEEDTAVVLIPGYRGVVHLTE